MAEADGLTLEQLTKYAGHYLLLRRMACAPDGAARQRYEDALDAAGAAMGAAEGPPTPAQFDAFWDAAAAQLARPAQ